MRYFHKQQNHFWKPIINLDKVLNCNILLRDECPLSFWPLGMIGGQLEEL
jgi:hypothetical protein